MSNLVHNERVKLRATFLNNLAVGALLGAIVIPAAVKITTHEMGYWQAVVYVMGGVVLSWGLGVVARWTLRDLKE